jgi:hypothetical protein
MNNYKYSQTWFLGSEIKRTLINFLDKEKEIEKFYSNKSDTYFIINSDILMGTFEFNSKLGN